MAPSIVVWAEDKNPDPLLRLLRKVFIYSVELHTWRRTPLLDRMRSGNGWREHRLYSERVSFIKQLADQLAKSEGVILFHYDGDKPWARRSEAEIPPVFDSLIRKKVVELLSYRRQPADAHQRLVEVVPFYSLEAWFYQATEQAMSLCTDKHQSKHHAFWQSFVVDRTSLDEHEKPKDNECLSDTANLELAQAFPVVEALKVQKSFFEAASRIVACAALRPLVRPEIVAAITPSP